MKAIAIWQSRWAFGENALRSPAKAIRTKSTSKHNIKLPKRSFRSHLLRRPPPTLENEPHVQRSRLTAHATKSGHAADHHHVHSTAPATKSAHRPKTARTISCACHEKPALDHQNMRFPLRLPRQVIKCARHHDESPILRACAVEMHFDCLEVSECTVNSSSELAGRGCAPLRSIITRTKNPYVPRVCGEKTNKQTNRQTSKQANTSTKSEPPACW